MKLIGMYKNYGLDNFWDDNDDIIFVVDNDVMGDYKARVKCALMVEPRSFLPQGYEYLEEHYDEYKYIFTFDNKLLEKAPNAFPLAYGTWWYTSDVPKTKLISMISSNKSYCEGHKERLKLAKILDDQGIVDVMGNWNGGRRVTIEEAMSEYMFNIALENDKQDYYFTEKFGNCLANKVVPIYYGAPKVLEYFNKDGIIFVEDKSKIPEIVTSLTKKDYYDRIEAINDNYERIKEYRSLEEQLIKHYSHILEEL